ncbi:hypothetical protein [Paramagnetospirillum magneticum]|uniref:Uncharacterized protein n=1 Tax=Paramagnetospirillum magneticum (strain ATCC 700264 / AMB-1) TaxID=342108 RepID=Q2W942_PARM1|nr:hypothetical protein [Paramagnetospirillum magneticum]BAE49633.1 hypothetical protein amb0829 [Paramagnetospirillum magneticum AMB-1]
MRRAALALCCLLISVPALAEDMPKSPKAPPPEPLPDATCDTTKADAGDWLAGRWVAPYSKWEFKRDAQGLTWKLEQKPDLNSNLGYKQGTVIEGKVSELSACTLRLTAVENGETAFDFEGVRTEDGKIYGYATNKAGQGARWTLRRER